MPFVNWDDSMSVGVKQFDDDHKELISYINKLHISLLSKSKNDVMEKILNGLVDYTKKHFSTEEQAMVKYSYPPYEQHKKEHDSLINKVTLFSNDFNSGKTSFSLELMSFLKDWLVNHINVSDKKYRDFFKSKGLN